MNAITQKQVKLKTGDILLKGLPVSFVQDRPDICLVRGDRAEPYKIRISSAFNPPSVQELEEQSNDGVCDSVLGERVEPDGWDEHGSPSWLLALGLI